MADDTDKLKNDIQSLLRGRPHEPAPEQDNEEDVYEQEPINDTVRPLVNRIRDSILNALSKEAIQRIAEETGVFQKIGQRGVQKFLDDFYGSIENCIDEFDFEERE